MDKRFFQLVFTPFFSSAMEGTDSRIPWQANIDGMVERLEEMPDKLKLELLAGLELELKATVAKLPRIPKDLQDSFKLKIEAIQEVLNSF